MNSSHSFKMTWLFEAQPPIAKCSCPAEGFTRTTLALSRSEGAGLGVERLPSTLYVQSHHCNDSNDDDADDHNDEDKIMTNYRRQKEAIWDHSGVSWLPLITDRIKGKHR